MNILVPLRPVRDPAGFTVNRRAQRIFVNRERFMLNPADHNALEAALRLADLDGQVIALAAGGESAREVLREARAAGAGRALWVPVEGAIVEDAHCVTRIVQQAVSHAGGVDLVLAGSEVIDGDMAQVAPRLAAAWGWPFVDEIYDVKELPEGGLGLTVARAGGYQLLGLDGPAVAGVARDCNRPRFATAGQIIAIYRDADAVERVTLADLGLDQGELKPATRIQGEGFPPERTLGRMLEGVEAVKQLAEAVRGN
jgi:electron transfer flavoprotein alpha/beta subunit